jgi:hypothetical protein
MEGWLGGKFGPGVKWQGYLLVVSVSALLYLNSIPGGFVFDDHEAIETNKDVR